MRSFRANDNLLAVSANNQETAINTVQTLDTSLLVGAGDIINLEPRRESNVDEMTGNEEPDTIYDLGGLAGGSLNFEKAQPQHFAFMLAYALGAISTAAAGSGYAHTITPIDGDVDASRSLPTFTAAQRYGNQIMKRRFASMIIDALTATFARDSWVKLAGTMKGTGLVVDNVTEETIAVIPGIDPFACSTSLTLAALAVQGSTAAERLGNVQRIRVELATGVWTDVSFTAVSAATPAVITVEEVNGTSTDPVNFKVLFIPDESSAAWMTFPSRVTETPLRVTDLTVKMGGLYTAAGGFLGGKELACEVESIEYAIQNNAQVEMCVGGGGTYADRVYRDGRVQTLKLNREFRDYILQQHIDSNDTFAVQILAEGALFDSPHKYTVGLYFPKVGVLSSPISANGKRLAEAGDFQVLQDSSEGSVQAVVKNLVATYMA